MDLSIVIVSWNAKKFLVDCLSSIYAKTDKLNAEIIVVDNLSTDGSQQAVKRLFPAVKLIENNSNLGFAKANNIGIRNSLGKYICLINSDVIVLENCLEKMITLMEAQPSVGVLGPKILNHDMTLQRTCRRFPTIVSSFLSALGFESLFKGLTFFPHDKTRDVDVLSGCFMMVRRKALSQVGPLDERFFFYAEDKDWCKRFRDAGWRNVFYPNAKAIHFGGSSSANAPIKFYIEMQKANIQYWRKHHGRAAQFIYLFIIFLHQIIRVIRGAAVFILKPSERNSSAKKIKRSVSCLKWLFSFNTELRSNVI